MSDEENSIQVNFGRPMPLFPLDQVSLLPQQVLPLHIFEPRYRQMIENALDGSGQIAMAVFEGRQWQEEYHGRPAICPAVCIGQIVQHEKLTDGRFNLLLQGVCRARVIEELDPDGEKLYRSAMLEPVGIDQPEEDALAPVRSRLEHALAEGPLKQMTASEPILEYIRNPQIPTVALLELVSFTMLNDSRVRYALLEEGDAHTRADLIEDELDKLSRLVRLALRQHPEEWPKGCSWN